VNLSWDWWLWSGDVAGGSEAIEQQQERFLSTPLECSEDHCSDVLRCRSQVRVVHQRLRAVARGLDSESHRQRTPTTGSVEHGDFQMIRSGVNSDQDERVSVGLDEAGPEIISVETVHADLVSTSLMTWNHKLFW